MLVRNTNNPHLIDSIIQWNFLWMNSPRYVRIYSWMRGNVPRGIYIKKLVTENLLGESTGIGKLAKVSVWAFWYVAISVHATMPLTTFTCKRLKIAGK